MSHIDEIIHQLVDNICPLEDLNQWINSIEVNDENLSKIEHLINLMEIHEEKTRSLRQKIRLKTGKHYIKQMLKQPNINRAI